MPKHRRHHVRVAVAMFSTPYRDRNGAETTVKPREREVPPKCIAPKSGKPPVKTRERGVRHFLVPHCDQKDAQTPVKTRERDMGSKWVFQKVQKPLSNHVSVVSAT